MTQTSSPNVDISHTENNETAFIGGRFFFDCDNLIMFCSNFEQLDVADQTETLLEVRLDELENERKKVVSSYENLMLSPDQANSREVKDQAKLKFSVCSDSYLMTRAHIIDLTRISRGTTNLNDTARFSSTAHLPQNLTSTSHNYNLDSAACIKVPPCDTEVFIGGYEEWPSFRDMFTAVYINHPKLTRVQKLYHLRNKTRDEAGQIVKRYTLCDENFDLAWDALKARYENKRVLVDKQLRILFNIPSATVKTSEALQKMQAAVNDCLCTFKTLNVKVDNWDPILIYLISTKLPVTTLSLWEQSLKSHRELPKWSQMDEFLINRFEVVERISSIHSTNGPQTSATPLRASIQTYLSQEKLNTDCQLCNSDHSIRSCPEFKKFTPQQRIDFVFKNKYCNNCLSSNHTKGSCSSKNRCFVCKKKHHTLLHMQTPDVSNISNPFKPGRNKEISPTENTSSQNNIKAHNDEPTTSSQAYSSNIQAHFSSNDKPILLRTALVQIHLRGELFTIRALIDPGSQRTFISERIRNLLRIPYRTSQFEIIGIGGQKQNASKECELTLMSTRKKLSFSINAIVLPKVSRQIPAFSFKISNPQELNELDLADPYFNQSSQIDLILGNDSERYINLDGMIQNICGEASAYNTIFGWVLSGPIKAQQVQSFSTNVISSNKSELCEIVKKFWEVEEIPYIKKTTPEDEFCEDFYNKTTTRQPDGRYVVRLPFKKEFPSSMYLGSSRFLALGQFSRMEQTLSKNPELGDQYKSVLNEYLELGHMKETSSLEISRDKAYSTFYLPHHAVVRPEHKTTKVRVVFNASRKTKSGFSLNDVLYTGPTLQNDLVETILKCRLYEFVFSGDIQKMYRQIIIHPADRSFQRILHQKDNYSPIKDYEITTVTFGVNCAPFLAIRTLKRLATESESKYPLGSAVLANESILNSEWFPLKKITANDNRLLSNVSTEDLYDHNFLRFHESSSVKTLGLKWNALTDTFSFSFSIPLNADELSRKFFQE